MVREIHEHEDGTVIGPAQESPDPEEIEEQRRPPSLGEILLREAEAQQAQREAERQAEAQRKATAEAEDNPVSIALPQIHAVAAPSSHVILSGAYGHLLEGRHSEGAIGVPNTCGVRGLG
jgi:hypothetical protein